MYILLKVDYYTVNVLLPYTIRGGGGALKAPSPPIFCPHAFNFGAALLCVGDFSQKIVYHRVAKFFFIGGHDLAVRGVSKYKVDMIFIIFREFNTMLEIVDSELYYYT